MAEFRFGLILLLALAFVQTGRTQSSTAFPTVPTPVDHAVNKVYSLADLGDDPNLCKWIAETIPQMIEPGCWTGKNLCYYEPAKVMAIHQTPTVHAEVEEFLAAMRKKLPAANRMKHDPQVAPAQFNPEPLRPVGPVCASQAYPVPAAVQTPKHLFHFIIRYEGEGIIDSNVTKFTEALTRAAGMYNVQSTYPQGGATPFVIPPGSGPIAPMAYSAPPIWSGASPPVMMPPAVEPLPAPCKVVPSNNPPVPY